MKNKITPTCIESFGEAKNEITKNSVLEILNNLFSLRKRYQSKCLTGIKTQADRGNTTLNKLILSQQMTGNLINDLLDLAKLENNSF